MQWIPECNKGEEDENEKKYTHLYSSHSFMRAVVNIDRHIDWLSVEKRCFFKSRIQRNPEKSVQVYNQNKIHIKNPMF